MRFAVVGDVHEHWDAIDVRAIDAAGYDAVLFTGDLADRLHRRTLDVARRIAELRTPALLVPGNHDGTSPLGVLAEAVGWGLRRPGARRRHDARMSALRTALGRVVVGGLSAHRFGDVTVIVGRPHAMDGRRASFAHAGVPTVDDALARLRRVIDEGVGPIVFLAHNGPAGLGADRAAPFALRRTERDLGDPDLAQAVSYAVARGRPVLAVVAGHLHHRGHDRRWQSVVDGVLYVNAARVPRTYRADGRTVRVHVALTVDARAGTASAREIVDGGRHG